MRRTVVCGLGLFATLALAGTQVAALQDPAPIPGWGDPVDPAGDSTFTLDEKAVVITVPATAHDLSPERSRKAPRVLRDIEGNFEVTLQLSATLEPGDTPAGPGMKPSQGAGLVFWQDDNNFVRLDRSVVTGTDGQPAYQMPLLLYCKDGRLAQASEAALEPLFTGPDTWLRLTRRGDKLTAAISPDGQTWTEAGSLQIRLPSRMRIGVVAVNTAKKPLTVRFESFRARGVSLSG